MVALWKGGHLKRLHVTVADSSPIISFWIAHMTAGNARGDKKEENKMEREGEFSFFPPSHHLMTPLDHACLVKILIDSFRLEDNYE